VFAACAPVRAFIATVRVPGASGTIRIAAQQRMVVVEQVVVVQVEALFGGLPQQRHERCERERLLLEVYSCGVGPGAHESAGHTVASPTSEPAAHFNSNSDSNRNLLRTLVA
jgi:hypothetical protein